MKTLQSVDWVNPLTVPLSRRLQTCMVLFYASLFVIIPLTGIFLLVFLMFTPFFFVSILYVTWIFVDTVILKSSSRGGRLWLWLRRHQMWGYMRDYFPIILVKTSELDPTKNYIFGYHPHGVLSFGAFCNFATDATGFSRAFPGLHPHTLTLKENFKLPLGRDLAMWLGVCDVSKESIKYLLTQQGPGHSVLIVIGGAEESLEARPGAYRLKLKHRKGFVKQALRCGAPLVPVYSFGESELFYQADNPEGSLIRRFQEKFKKLFGFAPPLFYGRGIFNYTFGFMPYRKPIVTVVGAPITVPQIDDPDQETIDKFHKIYAEELENIFNTYKTTYGIDEDKIIEYY